MNLYAMQGYYLIGTYFTYYTNVSKNISYKTGIYNKGLKTLKVNDIKFLFQPHEITIIEGSCWLEHINDFAYGCLTGLFVDTQHLEGLKEKEIEVVQGGFIEDTISIGGKVRNCFWGKMHTPTSSELAASFWSKAAKNGRGGNVYFYLEYGSNKPALISHLWCDGELVFGNKENSAFTSRNVLAKQIHQNGKYITYILSIS